MKEEVIIDGNGSDWFEKATFVLKKENKDQIPPNLVLYAEEIIETHLKKTPYQGKRQIYMSEKTLSGKSGRPRKSAAYQRGKYIELFFMISLLICAVSIGALLMRNFS